jgi:hypothetical protein
MLSTKLSTPGFETARVVSLVVLVILPIAPVAFGQSSGNELSLYTDAVAHAQPAERLILLERFAVHAQPGPLKVDALEMVIWHYLQQGQVGRAGSWANQLAATDENNPVAIALLANDSRPAVENGNIKPERLLKTASHGLEMLPSLQRPLGMNGADFELLKRQSYAMLSSAAGLAELRMKDFVAARVYLHNAIVVEPNNAQDLYDLGLADLNGSDPNRQEGYWSLARAVNLSQGTPHGVEMARDARARYVKDGGSTTDWNQFLAAAAAPNTGGATSTMVASTPPPSVPRPPSSSKQPVAASVRPPPAAAKPGKTQPPPSVWADNTISSQPPVPKRRVLSTSGPMSFGILVETSLANKENRGAVINSLTDMVRRLNDRDEAFILTYDNNIVFEQDLTSDPTQLEQAMENIKPQKGAVLDDAVAFAAGHLARIAKYPNRVLLVISDGRNVDSHASPTQTSAEINAAGVRIYCIGLDVTDAEGQYRLRQLAASTGGKSDFISTPGQFRNATRYIAQNLGIDFRF